MGSRRKTLRVTLAYRDDAVEVLDQEVVPATPVLRDPRPRPGADAVSVTLEGAKARYSRRLPDPGIGREVFHENGEISRTDVEGARVVSVAIPWKDDGRTVVVKAARADAKGKSPNSLKGEDAWRNIGELPPPPPPPPLPPSPVSTAAEPAPVRLFSGGPRALTLVFLAEGFTEPELPKFRATVDSFITDLRKTAPFKKMMAALSAVRVDAISAESGIDDPKGSEVDTWLDGRFGKDELRRLIEVDQQRALAAVKRAVPVGARVGIVVVNTAEYGGSGGPVSVFSCHPQAGNIALHELGHSLFGLADEYSDAGNSDAPPAEPNVTSKPNAQSSNWGPEDLRRLKWKGHVTSGLAIPTILAPNCDHAHDPPGPAGVGLFEGAKYRHCKRYRPALKCKMRNVADDFCLVCQEVIRRKLQTHL